MILDHKVFRNHDFVQMQEEPWSSSIAVCMALVDQLPDDFRLPAIMAFLPVLNEVRYTAITSRMNRAQLPRSSATRQ